MATNKAAEQQSAAVTAAGQTDNIGMTDEQIRQELDRMEADGQKQQDGETDEDAVVLYADLNADMLAVLAKLDITEKRNDIMLSAFYSVIRGKVSAKLEKSKSAYWEVSRRKKPELIAAAEQRVKDWMELLTTIEKVPEL